MFAPQIFRWYSSIHNWIIVVINVTISQSMDSFLVMTKCNEMKRLGNVAVVVFNWRKRKLRGTKKYVANRTNKTTAFFQDVLVDDVWFFVAFAVFPKCLVDIFDFWLFKKFYFSAIRKCYYFFSWILPWNFIFHVTLLISFIFHIQHLIGLLCLYGAISNCIFIAYDILFFTI